MDQLRTMLATVGQALGRLSVSQKLLIGSIAIILLMVLLLVSVYAGRADMKPLYPGQPAEVQQSAARILATSGIAHKTGPSGEILVASDQQASAMALMAQSGAGPANTELVFDNILKSQNWINTKEQNRQIYNLMRNNWLAGVIGKFNGVKSAQVLVDVPEQVGFGAPARPAKASVTLFSGTGKAIPQETVDAAARFVAGSVAGLEVERVEVIDGTSGRPRAVTNEREPAAASARENARQIEKDWKQKIVNLLPGIDGVAVEVTAVVDASRSRAQVNTNMPLGQGSVSTPKREITGGMTENQAAAAAEPGLRSNVGADVVQSGQGRASTRAQQTSEETEYAVAFGTRTEHIDDPGGRVRSLAATVAVPRAFILGLIQRDAAAANNAQAGGTQTASNTTAAPAMPSEQEIQARFAAERTSIEALLKPHFRMETSKGEVVQGEVVVALMSGEGVGGGSAASFGGGGAGGGGGGGLGGSLGTVWAMGGGMLDKVVLGVLAVVALGMMMLMVRKTGRTVEIPTMQELVGAPPPLETDNDIVGEADESETAMAGILVNDDEIKVQKMREQVAELVKNQPEMAVKVLNRWIQTEE